MANKKKKLDSCHFSCDVTIPAKLADVVALKQG